MIPFNILKEIKQLKERIENLENKNDFLDVKTRGIFGEEDNRKDLKFIKRFTLTSAQILTLNTTPITLITAFLNSVIIIEGITARLNFNTTAYTGANNLEFRYTNGSGAKVTADMANTFLNSSSTAYDQVAGVATELTPVLNTPIVVVVPTANPATGNSTLDLFIKYRVITF